MQRVVYILGAGFSAPLGLPVVRNFLEKAKDLFHFGSAKGDGRYDKMLREVGKLAQVKLAFNADLTNIKEILSILDMKSQFDGTTALRDEFAAFVCDVVKQSTPALTLAPAANPHRVLEDYSWGPYVAFVACLLNAVFWSEQVSSVNKRGPQAALHYWGQHDNPGVHYDVISLNYDCVLETAASAIGKAFGGTQVVEFARDVASHVAHPTWPRLAKLHGCVSDGAIVPPTWRKVPSDALAEQWTTAADILRHANHLRILGYSLPVSDAYIRYLLMAAASDAPHLKSVYVMTQDPDKTVHKRYQAFISKPTRYNGKDLAEYLGRTQGLQPTKCVIGGVSRDCLRLDLEGTHEVFVQGATG